MIRVNLLEGVRPHAETRVKVPAASSLAAFQAKAFAVSLLACAAVVSFFYWYWTRQIDTLNTQLAAEQREAARLKAIQAENDRYAKQLDEMEKRVRAIQALERDRAGPAQFMSALGGTVARTAGLYLVSASVKAGRLALQGQSPTVNAIADFITALRTSGSFEDVKLQQYFENDLEDRVSFKFSLDCVYRAVAEAAPPPQKAAGVPTRASAAGR